MKTATLLMAALLLPAATRAQRVIDPGMTKAQVIAILGQPAQARSIDSSVFLYYRTGKEKAVGMSDVVVLHGDKVVDAIFRTAERKYSGTSSSPRAIPAEEARKKGADSASTKSGPLKRP